MENYNKQKWEDLDLSRDEIKSIGEALKKEEFRTLLLDYVKEINDPENKKQYEEEITQLESERGVNVTFIHPSPGYVIKTIANGKHKAFVNICSNANIDKPTSTPSVNGEEKGLSWSIPHCIAPPRDDMDKKNNICTVYDVVFHPDTLHLTKSNNSFKKLVDETALDAVETHFNVSLDKVNLKFPKMQFKGMKQASVIRKKMQNFQPTEVVNIPNYPYPPLKDHVVSQNVPQIQRNSDSRNVGCMPMYCTPKHMITHRNSFDMQHFTNDPMSKMSATVPNELVVVIDLPLLKRSTDASLDVSEKSLSLISESPAKYKLELNLPYIVDSNNGNAKFDTDKKTLTVTLPVVQSESRNVKKIDINKDDSGIESDNINNERSRISSGSSSDDESLGKESKIIQYGDVVSIAQTFLKPNVHYSLPPLECFLHTGRVLKLNLLVPNVEPSSVEYISLTKDTMSGFHMSFLSTGNGFFTQHFAICFLLPPKNEIEDGTFSAEVWDSEVRIQAKLSPNEDNCDTFFVGIDEFTVEKKEFSHNTLRDSTNLAVSLDQEVARESNDDKKKGPEKSKEKENTCDEKENNNGLLENVNRSNKSQKELCETETINEDVVDPKDVKFPAANRHSSLSASGESGSSFDEESSSSPPRHSGKPRTQSESHHGNTLLKRRGILKIGRSLSESSADDYASWSSEKAEKSKKTVRFSDVISKQTFRLNSSILGQRKKNQKKMKNKKRAQERRLSESGNESEGDSDVFHSREKKFQNNETEIWSEEADTSSCDVSEVSDISESDDGQQKDYSKTYMPCSSRKNHKRRGKKSARKQAATAKTQFINH